MHVGQLWQEGNTTTPLATATFINESASGWQQVSLSTPVPITAGTTYVASYFSPNGTFSYSTVNLSKGVINGPLRALSAPGEVFENGAFGYHHPHRFIRFWVVPNNRNFLVDVIFNTTTTCLINGTLSVSGPVCAGEEIKLKLDPAVGQAPFSVTLNNASISGLTTNVEFGSGVTANDESLVNVSLWPAGTGGTAVASVTPTELGLKFRANAAGVISGIRFYKSVESGTGTFAVRLYDLTAPASPVGSGSVVISTAGISGWQQVLFASPINIEANKTYVASYVAPNGRYTQTAGDLLSAFTNGPLTALADDFDGPNGVYKTGNGSEAPNLDGNGANYWVDVIYTATNLIHFAQIKDAYQNVCFSNNPDIQTLLLQPVDCSFLPVSLVDFRLSTRLTDVILYWSTQSENVNLGFEVQRSTDGQNWVNIGFVKGAGDSQLLLKYQFTDAGLTEGKYFYRLKQIDLDGKSSYSKVISTTIISKLRFLLSQNYPNPASKTTTINYTVPLKSPVEMVLFDIQGRQIKVLVNELKDAGTHTIELDLRRLNKGVYYYKMKSGNYSDIKRLLVD